MIITDIGGKVNKTLYQVMACGEKICLKLYRGFEKPKSKNAPVFSQTGAQALGIEYVLVQTAEGLFHTALRQSQIDS